MYEIVQLSRVFLFSPLSGVNEGDHTHGSSAHWGPDTGAGAVLVIVRSQDGIVRFGLKSFRPESGFCLRFHALLGKPQASRGSPDC